MKSGIQIKHGVAIAALIIALLGVGAAAMSFFQGAGVNRDNPGQQTLEGSEPQS